MHVENASFTSHSKVDVSGLVSAQDVLPAVREAFLQFSASLLGDLQRLLSSGFVDVEEFGQYHLDDRQAEFERVCLPARHVRCVIAAPSSQQNFIPISLILS
jgi:hypothetical protein